MFKHEKILKKFVVLHLFGLSKTNPKNSLSCFFIFFFLSFIVLFEFMKGFNIFVFLFVFINELNGLIVYNYLNEEIGRLNSPLFAYPDSKQQNFHVKGKVLHLKEHLCDRRSFSEEFRNKILWVESDYCSVIEKIQNCQRQQCIGVIGI